MGYQIYFELLVVTGIGVGALLCLTAPWVLSGPAQISALRRTGMWLMITAAIIAFAAILLLPKVVMISPDRLP